MRIFLLAALLGPLPFYRATQFFACLAGALMTLALYVHLKRASSRAFALGCAVL
ncbi:MAG: hypothetical protein IE919_17945, partial [Thioclava sp.]|nr:hypothetical protein [Thioclava sp.]